MPMVKSGAKALGNIALKSGADSVGDVLAGKNVKEAVKGRTVETANLAKRKAMNKLRSQTGSGKRAMRSAKQSRSVKRTVKKRKASTSTARSMKCTTKKWTLPILAGGNGNAGFSARYVFNKTSGIVEMTGPIISDIFNVCPNFSC
jgi:hypothetical protein